jgi:GH25 family lysozyme M1 (1,4-beta-N-acetylmuramidase)
MAKICPVCGGLDIGCPECNAPPKHLYPKEAFIPTKAKLRFALNKLVQQQEVVWEVQGIDISAWNGVMDFSITKTKCQFVNVRLGYGNQWKDSRCDQYRRDLIANDIPYGVYWYCRPGEDPIAHAESFARVAKEYPYQLGTEEDYEQTTLGLTPTLDWIIACDTKLRDILINMRTSPYSNANFWNNKVATNTYFTQEQWVANWTSGNIPYMPRNWTWKKGCKWQHSADGNRKAKEYGMVRDGDVDMDLNRWYGSCAEFNTRYGTHIKPIGDVPPIQLPEFFTPNGSPGYINMRSVPNPYSDVYIIGRANNGKKWKPIELVIGTDGKEWWRINEYAYVAKWLTKW